jgi:hypothetical protein
MEPYRSHFPHARLLVPETERLSSRVLTFPTGGAVAPADIATIAGIIRAAQADAEMVKQRLRQVDVEADVSFPGRGPVHGV